MKNPSKLLFSLATLPALFCSCAKEIVMDAGEEPVVAVECILSDQPVQTLRLDIGYQHTFRTGRFTHDLNVGIYNVTNHFNPFTLYFDAEQEKWMAISLLPIMPNFSYRVTF